MLGSGFSSATSAPSCKYRFWYSGLMVSETESGIDGVDLGMVMHELMNFS